MLGESIWNDYTREELRKLKVDEQMKYAEKGTEELDAKNL